VDRGGRRRSELERRGLHLAQRIKKPDGRYAQVPKGRGAHAEVISAAELCRIRHILRRVHFARNLNRPAHHSTAKPALQRAEAWEIPSVDGSIRGESVNDVNEGRQGGLQSGPISATGGSCGLCTTRSAVLVLHPQMCKRLPRRADVALGLAGNGGPSGLL
jgi:hypothetical protein